MPLINTEFNAQHLNNLLVDATVFSDIACLWGRAFGVHTECERCDLNINYCVRKNILENLVKAQDIAERELGYSLTPRYHSQTITWDRKWSTGRNSKIRLQLPFPGIELVNVIQQADPIEALESVSVNFALIEGVPLTTAVGEKYCIATLDSEFVENPNRVTLRSGSKVFTQDPQATEFPRRDVDGNWEIAIIRISDPDVCDEDIDAYHCELVYVDITPPECEGEIVPVYPGTTQHIPVAKPVETLENDDLRYWFYVWELVDPAFGDETVRITQGEYYKLFQTISFLCVHDVESLPTVVCNTGCGCGEDDPNTDCELIIVDPVNGVVELCCESSPCGCGAGCSHPKSLTIHYKTNPDILGFDSASYSLKEGISYWAASILPLESCRCKIEHGFIRDAQKAYTEIRVNPLSGEEIHNLKHGNLYGQLVFSERLNGAPHYYRLLTL
jgi:hypothetical protein